MVVAESKINGGKMDNKPEERRSRKGLFARLLEKLDKKLVEKSKSGCSCKNGDNGEKKSCCS